MLHTAGYYGKHQHRFLHLYLTLAKLTRVPILGKLVRWVANGYARHGHGGYYLTLVEAEKIVDISNNVFLGPCSCRKEHRNCEYPIMSEIVLGDALAEIYVSRKKELRQISKEEAKSILRQAHQKRLVQSIMRCGEHFYAICSCCNCCCVPRRLQQTFGIGRALVRNPHVVQDFQHQLQ